MDQQTQLQTEAINSPRLWERREPFRMTISGKIEPYEWDEWDRVTRVSIVSPRDELEYEVAENSKGRELLQMVGIWISARGLVSELRKGVFEIKVADYTLFRAN